MPLDDALGLVKSNFDEYCADVRAGRIPSRLAPVHTPAGGPPSEAARPAPASGGMPAQERGDGPQVKAEDISSEQLSSLISSLREKQQVLGQEPSQQGPSEPVKQELPPAAAASDDGKC